MKPGIRVLILIVLAAASAGAKEIRVGITEYQNVESVYNKYQGFFEELEQIAAKKGADFTFKFAIGTYGEVLDWYNKKLIDVAILSAMPMADLLSSSDPREVAKIKDAVLARLNPIGGSGGKCDKDLCKRSLDEPAAECRESTGTAKSEYHVSVVVPAEYGWKSFDDVRKLAGKHQLRFLFVRPVSVSGFIVPLYYLRQQKLDQEDFEFTYQHQESLQRMLRKDPKDAGKALVAFVIENTSYCVPPAQANRQLFTTIEWKELSAVHIPHEVMVVNSNLDEPVITDLKQTMRPLLERRAENEQNAPDKNFTVTIVKPETDWLKDYDESRKIYETTHGARSLQYGSSLKDLITSLNIYQESTGERPRLALVLSGGGAKCAYQAGAIAQIEKKLKDFPADPRFGKRDFELVVGTSGGAINALLTALGGTQDPLTQDRIRDMWVSFHQEQFFTPSFIFKLVFGLCFGLLQALVITFAVLLFGRRHLRWKRIGQLLVGVEVVEIVLAEYLGAVNSSFAFFVLAQVIVVVSIAAFIRIFRQTAIWLLRTPPGAFWRRLYNQKVGEWWRIAGWLMIIVSTIEILIARGLNPSLWPTAFESHAIGHLWLLFLLMCTVAYPWPLVLGLAMVLSGLKGRMDIDWNSRRLWLVRMLTMLVLIFAGVLFLTSLWKDRSPSDSGQIEKAFITRIPQMLNILHPGFESASGGSQEDQLQDISARIVKNPTLLKRDLVITVSNLPLDPADEPDDPHLLTANQLPEDLYFYSKSPLVKWDMPPPDRRFISFQENPQRLLDVVIGSGTIYPLFPYRELSNINLGGNKRTPLIKVIDGGFIHNSPIEAATTWGATHIISIEASPLRKPFEPRNTFENSLVAFSYIMAQTQRADTSVRGHVEIFELRPRSGCEKKNREVGCNHDPEPDMDTFDFDPDLLDKAFKAGEGDVSSDLPLFKRLPGPPLFRVTQKRDYSHQATR
jgi:predicted acylesterase/phospholipase RssA/ABC-type phosphate/phosphonate transport system substrate-binding protein